MTSILGLELGGNEELAAATVESIYDALIDHQVLFFRNQPLTPEMHVRLGQLLGDLAPRHHSYNTLPEHGDVAVLDWQPGDRPDASEWHSDMTFREKPPFASILKAVIVPPVGGDTLWASMYSVYDSLDPGFRSDLEGMQICHDPGQFRNGAYESAGNQGITDMMVSAGSAVWPIVSHHPVTGGRTSTSASRTRDGSWGRALVNPNASSTICSMRSTGPTIRSGCGGGRTRLQSGTTGVRSTTRSLTTRRIGASCIVLLLTPIAASSSASLNDHSHRHLNHSFQVE